MQIVYAMEEAPRGYAKSLFLAGPTPRSADVKSWRPQALEILERLGYDGVVFAPEPRDQHWRGGHSQIEWEEIHLNMADCILFWIPRELATMPALTTNTEWGRWEDSGKVVFGAPAEAVKVGYQLYYAQKYQVPIAETLGETITHALSFIGEGAWRKEGEREVPLYIWNTLSFQNWYWAQKSAENRLDGARVVWPFRIGLDRSLVFFWALHVNVYIASENRQKTNEVVIARPDLVAILLYRKKTPISDSDIVLIREFRSPAATVDGYIWELPGGSSFDPNKQWMEVAIDECAQETSLEISPQRLRCHGSRQPVSTISAHKARVYSVEITEEELDYLRSQKGIPHGVLEDTERTYVEIRTLGEICQDEKIDWSMLGMILSIIHAKK